MARLVGKENICNIDARRFFGLVSRKYGNVQEVKFRGCNAFIYC